jgi:uncharacterized membrane protein
MNTLKKDLPIIALVVAPIIYLAFLWKNLPSQVPTHFNIDGEINNWGDKSILVLMVFLLPVLTYLIFLIIPKIDPKNKLEAMGGKYQQLKFILVGFMSAMAFFIITISKNQSISNINFLFVLLGLMFMLLGNYFKVIKPNYFLGIKTPWTLHNDEVWKTTHILAGKLWIAGGLLIIILCFLLPQEITHYVFLAIVSIIVIIPVGYSYFKFKEIQKLT